MFSHIDDNYHARLHYVVFGSSRTVTRNYYTFYEDKDDIDGNKAYWLRPPEEKYRDRIVITVVPGFLKLKTSKNVRVACQSLEVKLADITGVDYYNGISGGRLALEVSRIRIRSFSSEHAMDEFYKSLSPSHHPTHNAMTDSSPIDGLSLTSAALTMSPSESLNEMTPSTSPSKGRFCPGDRLDDTNSSLMASRSGNSSRGTMTSSIFQYEGEHLRDYDKFHNPSTILQLYFLDPSPIPLLVREVILKPPLKSEKYPGRLLRLYEQGMPSWCMFLCRWGLYYRRWVRISVHYLLHVYPIISLGCGLYDLYFNLTYVQEFIRSYLNPLRGFIAEWDVFRVLYLLNILGLTLHHARTLVFSFFYPFVLILQPLFYTVYYVIVIVKFIIFTFWTVLWAPFQILFLYMSFPFSSGTVTAAASVASNSGSFLHMFVDFWAKVARPVKNVIKGCYDTIMHIGTLISKHELTLRRWVIRTRPDIVLLVFIVRYVFLLSGLAWLVTLSWWWWLSYDTVVEDYYSSSEESVVDVWVTVPIALLMVSLRSWAQRRKAGTSTPATSTNKLTTLHVNTKSKNNNDGLMTPPHLPTTAVGTPKMHESQADEEDKKEK